MPSLRTRPSLTSIVAFFLIVAPLVYVLSYAPVVRVCGRTAQFETDYLSGIVSWSGGSGGRVQIWPIQRPMADASLYPAYGPVDWLIDNTPLREPLFFWAGIWDVREEFETGWSFRPRSP